MVGHGRYGMGYEEMILFAYMIWHDTTWHDFCWRYGLIDTFAGKDGKINTQRHESNLMTCYRLLSSG